MVAYSRKVEEWSASPVTEDSRRNNRAEFLLDDDETGVSVWRCDGSDTHLNCVLAAVMIGRARNAQWGMRVRTLDLLHVPEADLVRFGDPTHAPAPDGQWDVLPANDLHYELRWDQARIDALVDAVGATGLAAAKYLRARVKLALASLTPEQIALDARDWVERRA